MAEIDISITDEPARAGPQRLEKIAVQEEMVQQEQPANKHAGAGRGLYLIVALAISAAAGYGARAWRVPSTPVNRTEIVQKTETNLEDVLAYAKLHPSESSSIIQAGISANSSYSAETINLMFSAVYDTFSKDEEAVKAYKPKLLSLFKDTDMLEMIPSDERAKLLKKAFMELGTAEKLEVLGTVGSEKAYDLWKDMRAELGGAWKDVQKSDSYKGAKKEADKVSRRSMQEVYDRLKGLAE